MNILVLGKGGREHALIQALNQSPRNVQIFCYPGSDAIGQIATIVQKPPNAKQTSELAWLAEWMKQTQIDYCLPGDEAWLVQGEGIAAKCQQIGIPCWGPPRASAQLEASKSFAKNFLQRHHIPTAQAVTCQNQSEVHATLAQRKHPLPVVLKFDGLAAGKGVAVCHTQTELQDFLEQVFTHQRFGPGQILVEDHLTGPEISIFAAVADNQYLLFTPARDYKRLQNQDQGPNTGGMGAVASRHLLPAHTLAQIEREIIQPTVQGLHQDQLPYRGFLYFGLMLTPDGPKVIEYNCRFGDPECQAVMPLLHGDLATFCAEGAQGQLNPELLTFSDGWSVTIVLASAGYPTTSRSGDPIQGLEQVETAGLAQITHAGTKLSEGQWTTNGGRVLALTKLAPTRSQAVQEAYQELAKIHFPDCQFRRDIGTWNFESQP